MGNLCTNQTPQGEAPPKANRRMFVTEAEMDDAKKHSPVEWVKKMKGAKKGKWQEELEAELPNLKDRSTEAYAAALRALDKN